jgi:hypothetical protein
MADSYIKWLDEIKEAVDWDRATNGIFEQYLPELPKQAKPKKPDFKVTKGKVTHTKRRINGGKITVEMDDIDNYAMFNRDSRMQDGLQFTAEFDDGTRLKYRPWDNANLYAQRGELEIVIDGDASGKKVEAMMTKLEKLGIDARISSPENAEQMYLEKMAYIRKVDHTAEYKRLQKRLDDRDASVNERVQTLREFWQKELNVEDITKLPDYDPMGAYQAGFLDRGLKGGYRHQYRFDITEEDLEKNMKGARHFRGKKFAHRFQAFPIWSSWLRPSCHWHHRQSQFPTHRAVYKDSHCPMGGISDACRTTDQRRQDNRRDG